MIGKLYVVATPIGNMEDISLRAIRILKGVNLILAEDTRITKKLLMHYEIDRDIVSYHQHSSDGKKSEILLKLLEGKNIALVTDAGTPGVSDPGNELIEFLLEKEPQIGIIPIPGASSLTAALSVSGVRSDKFIFLGFLPKKGNTKTFEWLKNQNLTFCYFDSPHRVIKNLKGIQSIFGKDTYVVVFRELTKMYESIYRGMVNQVICDLEDGSIKGEIVVCVPGKNRTSI